MPRCGEGRSWYLRSRPARGGFVVEEGKGGKVAGDSRQETEGEKQARNNSLWAWDGNVKAIKYWDSIKTDALVKKAYQEGAQMVRDSITSANLKKIAADSLKKVK